MPVDVSIVVPTHNRACFLAELMGDLSRLHRPERMHGEIIIIASACRDDTEAVVARHAAEMPFPAHCLVEPQPGVGRARNRGVAAAQGNIVVFLDDDVRVEPDLLAAYLEVFERYPADLVAGRVVLWWNEVPQPPWYSMHVESLMPGRDHGDAVRELFHRGDLLGATFALRRRVLAVVVEFRTDLGRSGDGLLGGEEVDFTARALVRGFRLFYAPRAVARHRVEARRVMPDFLGAASFGEARSRVYMDVGASRWRALRKMLSGGMQATGHFLPGQWWCVVGNERRCVASYLRRQRGLGKLVGGFECLCHPRPPRDA